MNNIMKIVKSLKKFGLWIKDVSETIQNDSKNKKVGFSAFIMYIRRLVY